MLITRSWNLSVNGSMLMTFLVLRSSKTKTSLSSASYFTWWIWLPTEQGHPVTGRSVWFDCGMDAVFSNERLQLNPGKCLVLLAEVGTLLNNCSPLRASVHLRSVNATSLISNWSQPVDSTSPCLALLPTNDSPGSILELTFESALFVSKDAGLPHLRDFEDVSRNASLLPPATDTPK